jgi:hypothetical protein
MEFSVNLKPMKTRLRPVEAYPTNFPRLFIPISGFLKGVHNRSSIAIVWPYVNFILFSNLFEGFPSYAFIVEHNIFVKFFLEKWLKSVKYAV